jgi:NAD(P)H-nitrite reductase large subunit
MREWKDMSAAPKLSKNETIDLKSSVPGGDSVSLYLELNGREIVSGRLFGTACTSLLKLMAEWRPKLKGSVDQIPLPKGEDHASILIRELVLKAQGRWDYPYKDEELCHCRAVATSKVDASIIAGCKTASAVSRETSAGTSCGSCKPDIDAVLRYRLGRN